MKGALYYFPYVDGSTNIGLMGGALYNVPDTSAAIGNITVGATGFNVTCGFQETLKAEFLGDSSQWELSYWDGSSGVVGSVLLESTLPGIISTLAVQIFYSTIPILDSNNNTGGSIHLTPSMNTTVSSIQVFQCSLSLVEQTAIVDAQFRKAVTLQPELRKTTSTWLPALDTEVSTGNSFIDAWGGWYSSMPSSDFPRDPNSGDEYISVKIADLYLIQKFNLQSGNRSSIPSAVRLHDLENTLSDLLANMFWTVGHIPPPYQVNITATTVGIEYTLVEVQNPIVLLPGKNATATQWSTEIRLNLSIIAISTDLAASVALMLLSLAHLLLPTEGKEGHDLPIDGTGLLHVIWLYRNHPELEVLLEQVENPTEDNLRHAGMVPVTLLRSQRETESR